MPGVQNPHCTAPFSTNAPAIVSARFVSNPSKVLTSAFSSFDSLVKQANLAFPLMLTIQAPQVPCPEQPSFAEVICKSLRR